MKMSSNDHGNNKDHVSLNMEDIEEDAEWQNPQIPLSSRQLGDGDSGGENGDGGLSASVGERQKSTVPQDRIDPKNESKPRESGKESINPLSFLVSEGKMDKPGVVNDEENRTSEHPHNQGTNHDKVSKFLSGWRFRGKRGKEFFNQKIDQLKSLSSKGRHNDDEEDDEEDEDAEEKEEKRRFVGKKIDNLDGQVKKWKELLKSVRKDKTEDNVKRKVDRFLDSQNLENLE